MEPARNKADEVLLNRHARAFLLGLSWLET
jgi:hypothetical protein